MPPDFTIADAQLNVKQIRLYVERFKAAHAINLRTEIRADMLRDVVKSLILQLSAKVASKKVCCENRQLPRYVVGVL